MILRLLITAAVFASASPAHAGGLATAGKPSPDEYVVYVDKLNLRDRAGAEGRVVAVLARGDTVTSTAEAEWLPGTGGSPAEPWFEVEAEAGQGWLAGRFVIPRELFEDYARADELGKAGRSGDMLEELSRVAAAREVPASPAESSVFVSPDTRKAACWGGFLGDEPNTVVFGPHLYFEVGEGLADVFYGGSPQSWSDDSRYVGLGVQHELVVYDTSSGRSVVADDDYWYRCEFVGGYFVYKAFGGRVPNPDGGYFGENRALPAVRAYNPATGEKVDVLKADPSSVRPLDAATMEARLEPAPACPDVLTGSELYKEFNGAFVQCWESEA
jgi:hypothetical protein